MDDWWILLAKGRKKEKKNISAMDEFGIK